MKEITDFAREYWPLMALGGIAITGGVLGAHQAYKDVKSFVRTQRQKRKCPALSEAEQAEILQDVKGILERGHDTHSQREIYVAEEMEIAEYLLSERRRDVLLSSGNERLAEDVAGLAAAINGESICVGTQAFGYPAGDREDLYRETVHCGANVLCAGAEGDKSQYPGYYPDRIRPLYEGWKQFDPVVALFRGSNHDRFEKWKKGRGGSE